jgi:hypothetical protein
MRRMPDRTPETSIVSSKRPVDTSILFQAVVSQFPHYWIRLGQRLAEIYIRNYREMDATMILEVIWRNRCLHGITFLEAPGLKLAALLEQDKRLDEAARILDLEPRNSYRCTEAGNVARRNTYDQGAAGGRGEDFEGYLVLFLQLA